MSARTNNDLDVALGLGIRLRRHAMGLSQHQLGERIGVSFQQVQKYERGANRVSVSTLVGICEALDCQVTDLIAEVVQLRNSAAETLVQPEAAPLLQAMSRIRSPARRRAVLELAQSLAAEA